MDATAVEQDRASTLDERVAAVCGELNAAHARLVEAVAEVDASDSWAGQGLRSLEHWVAWKTGMSPSRAAQVVAIARRREELPDTMTAFANGELAVDQVAVVVTRTPGWADAEMCQLARHATVTQLRTVVGRYPFPSADESPAPARTSSERCSFATGDDGRFRLSAEGGEDGGAIIDAALREARDRLFHDGQSDVSWWDALVEVAQRSLDQVADPARRDRFKVYLHLDADRIRQAAFTDGWALPDAIRRYLTCNGAIQPVWERDNLPIGVGRTTRTIPVRLERIVRRRDGGCRVPGCGARRWLDVHHILHWEDDGPTETWNLVCLCAHHHRLHHNGRLGITGNADDPDGLRFTNQHGIPIRAGPAPRPPTGPPTPPASRYEHPTGERLDLACIHFNQPRPACAEAP